MYADFLLRLFALMIDAIVLIFLGACVGISVQQVAYRYGAYDLTSFNPPLWSRIILGISEWVVVWLYFSGLESSRWQATPGKRLMRIQVTDMNGQRISFPRATARLAAKSCSAVPFFAGFLMAGLTAQRQAAHDLIANTLVVRRARRNP